MQAATVTKAHAGPAEITAVRRPGKVYFRFDCSECGNLDGHLTLTRIVPRRFMAAMLKLAVDAHLRTHS